MTRNEAIKIAKQLSGDQKELAVVFDRQLNDYFISESEWFQQCNDFYSTSGYEIICLFKP